MGVSFSSKARCLEIIFFYTGISIKLFCIKQTFCVFWASLGEEGKRFGEKVWGDGASGPFVTLFAFFLEKAAG